MTTLTVEALLQQAGERIIIGYRYNDATTAAPQKIYGPRTTYTINLKQAGTRKVTDEDVERGLTAFYGINSQKYSLPTNSRRDMRAALESFVLRQNGSNLEKKLDDTSFDSITFKRDF